jgi:tetratricopeptide (TPR) repeat protein
MERHDSSMARLHRKLGVNENSRVFARLADAFRQNEHIEEAIELCHQGLRHHPEYVSGHIVLGQCYLDLDRLDEARDAFLRALALDEENVLVLKSLGSILFRQGKFREAHARYRQALRFDPRNYDLQEMVRDLEAKLQEDASQEERSVERAAPQESPADTSAPQGGGGSPPAGDIPFPSGMEVPVFGKEILEERTPEEHRRWIREMDGDSGARDPEKEPRDPKSGSGDQMQSAHLSPQESELVRDEEDEHAGKGPPRGMATATLAEIYFKQGLLDKAIEVYRKVLRHDPDDGRSRRRLGELRTMRSSHSRDAAGEDDKPVEGSPIGEESDQESASPGDQNDQAGSPAGEEADQSGSDQIIPEGETPQEPLEGRQ